MLYFAAGASIFVKKIETYLVQTLRVHKHTSIQALYLFLRIHIMALAAALIGYKKWAPDMSRVGCSDTWTDPGDGAVIKLLVPSCYDYKVEFGGASHEVIVFLMCLGFIAYAVRTLLKKEKAQDWLHWIALGLGLWGALYIPLAWAARQHVEGDWRPTPLLVRVMPPGWTAENYQDNVWRAHGWNETEISYWNEESAKGAARVARMSNKLGGAAFAYAICFMAASFML